MGKGDSLEAVPNATSNRSVLEEYNYKVGKVIGTGSYGTVYEAYHTKQKVMVAIKIISKKKASDDYLNKFLPRELQVSSEDGGELQFSTGTLEDSQNGMVGSVKPKALHQN